MIATICTLAANDLATAFKNKTLYLILFIPIFLFAALELIDDESTIVTKVRIGLIEGEAYAPSILKRLQSSPDTVVLSWLATLDDSRDWLRKKQGDAVLSATVAPGGRHRLVVVNESSLTTAAVVTILAELQRDPQAQQGNWIAGIVSLQSGGVQRQMLPTWILMLVLTVAFIVLPAQVAEEKEKKLLLGLLQTPMREWEWLLAKISYGVILILAASLLLHALTTFDLGVESGVQYLFLMLAGGFCFCSFGVLVGFLCRSQAAARTLGVLFYLPLLLPSALGEFSQSLSVVAPVIPSYQFYQPLRGIFLDEGATGNISEATALLVGTGLLMSLGTLVLMRKRWLM